MTSPDRAWLGPVAHIGIVSADFDRAKRALGSAGTSWCAESRPTARLELPTGEIVVNTVRYVAARGGEPRLKIVEAIPDGFWQPSPHGWHHLAYWVDELDPATDRLVAGGWRVEATGLGDDGSARYRYLVSEAGRIELGLERNRAEFDAWADGG